MAQPLIRARAEEPFPDAGPFDLVVHIETETLESLNEWGLSRIRGVDGVIKTSTAIILDL